MSSFMKKVSAIQQKQKERIREKLGSRATVYMGDPSLQWGMGGWIRGRCNLCYGPSGSGKTTLLLKAAAELQKQQGGWVVIFDSEYAHAGPLNPEQDKALERYTQAGLDIDKVLVIQSNEIDSLFGELSSLEEDIKSDSLDVCAIIVDSWGGVQSGGSRKNIDKGEVEAAGNSYGGNAKVMAPILQTLLRISAENGVTCLFVQHCIVNMEKYGPKFIMIGGQKLRFLVHGILYVESIQAKDASLLEDGSASENNDFVVRVGKKIRFRCEKSREVIEGRKGEFFFNFETMEFARPEESLFNLASSLGVIGHPQSVEIETKGPKKGKPKLDKDGNQIVKISKNYWEFPVGGANSSKFNGAEKTMEGLKNNKELFDAVAKACNESKSLSSIGADVKLGEEVGFVETEEEKNE